MDSVISLDHIGSADEYRAGGKACNCARLKQAGFPVPEGLVVSATATAAELAVLSTHPWFDTFGADALFAVRSSGIGEDGIEQSFAGIHETYLNVGRAGIASAVAACRASARSVQALAYRRANGISTDTIQIGVLVHRMVQPSAAGVAFTLDPVTGTTSEVVINSSWGVGEKLVSGQVDPDEFHVRKDDGRVVSSVIGEKTEAAGPSGASLTPSQLRELSALAVAIERHYGTPQDIEWCHDGRQFWIVQARPVTTGRARAVETEWTRANLVEVLPDLVSPQALTAIATATTPARPFISRAEPIRFVSLLLPACQGLTVIVPTMPACSLPWIEQ